MTPASFEITVKEASRLWKEGRVKLLDVRGEEERRLAAIEGVPMLDGRLAAQIVKAWSKDTALVLHCHHGIRSLEAAYHFARQGFTNVRSLAGGIDAWSCEVDPSVPRY